MLNKNSLAVKKCEANQKQGYKRPKHLISRKAKKTKFTVTEMIFLQGIFTTTIDFVT